MNKAPHQFISKHVGERIRQRRLEFEISASAFSSALGISTDMLMDWEEGRIWPPGLTLFDIAHLLAVPAAYFYEGLRDVDGSTSFLERDREGDRRA